MSALAAVSTKGTGGAHVSGPGSPMLNSSPKDGRSSIGLEFIGTNSYSSPVITQKLTEYQVARKPSIQGDYTPIGEIVSETHTTLDFCLKQGKSNNRMVSRNIGLPPRAQASSAIVIKRVTLLLATNNAAVDIGIRLEGITGTVYTEGGVYCAVIPSMNRIENRVLYAAPLQENKPILSALAFESAAVTTTSFANGTENLVVNKVFGKNSGLIKTLETRVDNGAGGKVTIGAKLGVDISDFRSEKNEMYTFDDQKLEDLKRKLTDHVTILPSIRTDNFNLCCGRTDGEEFDSAKGLVGNSYDGSATEMLLSKQNHITVQCKIEYYVNG